MQRRDIFQNPQYQKSSRQNPKQFKGNKIEVKKFDDKQDLLNELNISINIV